MTSLASLGRAFAVGTVIAAGLVPVAGLVPAASAASATSAPASVPPASATATAVQPAVLAAVPNPSQLRGVGTARQIVVVSNPRNVSYATLTAFERTSSGWRAVSGLTGIPARIGSNGFVTGSLRRQGTGTTPAGSFSLGPGFGTLARPSGSRLAYRVIRESDRWMYDRNYPSTYNTYQPSGNVPNQERLKYVPRGQYRYAVLIGFNHPRMSLDPTVKVKASPSVSLKAGGGIFLHVKKYVDGVSQTTAGCVGIDQAQMVAMLRWLDPAKAPRIIMGPRSLILRSSTTPLATTAALQPQASTAVIGYSRAGRPITATRIGPRSAPHTLVLIGSIHGSERQGHRVIDRVRSLTLPAGLRVILIRTMNPDGAQADRRTNARGVDLNRNFPRLWKQSGSGTSRWSGPSAASEPETQAVRRYLDRLNPGLVVIFHSDLNGVDSYGAKRMSTVTSLAAATGFRVGRFDCTGGCHGTLTQWFNATQAGQAITFEFGPGPDSSVINRVARGVLRVGATT